MNTRNLNTKDRLFVALAATGVVLGIAAAGFLASVSGTSNATAVVAESPLVSSTETVSPNSTSDSPTIPETTDIDKSAEALAAADIAAYMEQYIENNTDVKVTLKPVPTPKPGSTTGSTPKPGTATGSTPATGSGSTEVAPACDPADQGSRIWASCTAGYVAPEIVFAGLVSCVAVDREAGNWRYTVQFKLSGGNHNGVKTWSGFDDNSRGITSYLLKGEKVVDFSVPETFAPVVFMKPMNGMDGSIDRIEGFIRVDVDLSEACK